MYGLHQYPYASLDDKGANLLLRPSATNASLEEAMDPGKKSMADYSELEGVNAVAARLVGARRVGRSWGCWYGTQLRCGRTNSP